MVEASGRGGGAAAVDEAAGTAELSSPCVWSPGAGHGDSGVVSTVDVAVERRGGAITVRFASRLLATSPLPLEDATLLTWLLLRQDVRPVSSRE